MRALSSFEILRLRDVQDSSMGDLCKIITRDFGDSVAGRSVYGTIEPQETTGPAIACGFHQSPGLESVNPDVTSNTQRAKIRLPKGTVITQADHIQITHVKGFELAEPLLFEIEGQIKDGPTGLWLNAVAVVV